MEQQSEGAAAAPPHSSLHCHSPFLLQHSIMGRARERKPSRYRHSAAASKNLSKLEPGQRLAFRLLAPCLLTLAICACAVKLLLSAPLSPQTPPAAAAPNGVYWTGGKHPAGGEAEEIEPRRRVVSVDVPQWPSAPPILARSDGDPSGSPPELGTELGTLTIKSRTGLKGDLGTQGGNSTSSPESVPPSKKDDSSRKSSQSEIEVPKPRSNITCDDMSKDDGFPYARPIVCKISGDVRIAPGSSSVTLTNPLQHREESLRVRPYARQDDALLPLVREVLIKAAAAAATESSDDALKCGVSHDVPAVVFSIGGYTGNFFHDMSDVLIPLYLTSFQFKGSVQFFVTNYKQWWIQKYKPMLRRLSHYNIIDFDSNKDVHCFNHVILGLVRDRDLILRRHPTRNPKGYSMIDFTRFLRHAYGLRRDRQLVLGQNPGKKPRMLIISRRGTRRLLNLQQVEAMARALGFDVTVSEACGGVGVKRFAATVSSCDVLVAVHGAGLTNQVFLPPRGVVVQIVPWGKMEWMATNFYGAPARGMGLRYLEYHVAKEESSLAQRYPRDHTVFRDPMAIHGQGWKALADTVMTQDVRLDLGRFRPTLLHAMDLLQT